MILMRATLTVSCHTLGGVPGMSLVTRWTWKLHILRCPQKSSKLDLQVTEVIFVSGTQFVWQTIFTSAKISITHFAWQRRQGSRHILPSGKRPFSRGHVRQGSGGGTYPRLETWGRIASIKSKIPGNEIIWINVEQVVLAAPRMGWGWLQKITEMIRK